jgi:hypothetical protein
VEWLDDELVRGVEGALMVYYKAQISELSSRGLRKLTKHLRMVGVSFWIRTEYLPNNSLEYYCYFSPLSETTNFIKNNTTGSSTEAHRRFGVVRIKE